MKTITASYSTITKKNSTTRMWLSAFFCQSLLGQSCSGVVNKGEEPHESGLVKVGAINEIYKWYKDVSSNPWDRRKRLSSGMSMRRIECMRIFEATPGASYQWELGNYNLAQRNKR